MPNCLNLPRLAALSLALLVSGTAMASEESLLIDSINTYRSQVQRCADQASMELPPLTSDPRLILPPNSFGDLQQALAQAAYPMVMCRRSAFPGRGTPQPP